jgi:uncharacterized DUF497 family protein
MEFDPQKSLTNKEKHGIYFHEAQVLWQDVNRIEIPARTEEPRFLLIGMIEGKHWSVVSLQKTQKKMEEYVDNGCRLGWLLNRKKQEVEIYRPRQEVEVLKFPQALSGENVLPGFVLDMQQIWG